MPKDYTVAMMLPRRLMLMLAWVLTGSIGLALHADDADPGIDAGQFLLKQAVQPQGDGSHNAMLLGLRELEDPALLPLFQGLRNSPYLSMRVHGTLGAAALSPQRRLDLTDLAEIEDQRELVQILSAAIDDDLIDNPAMATLLTWDGLDLPLRQAIALRLMGAGGAVDTQPFKASLDVELATPLNAAKLLQYALAAMLLAESGDQGGQAALGQLPDVENESINAVIGQTLDAGMRQGFKSVGPLGLAIANDSQREPALRLLAIQSALRVGHPAAAQTWRAMFENEQSLAQRIRLAMIALDASEQVEPALFDTLANQGEWIGLIAAAGRAIAHGDDDLAKAFEPLIATGQPLSVQWVVTYCQRANPEQGPALLELVIRHHSAGPKQQRGRIIQLAIDAASVLSVQHPEQAAKRLLPLLTAEADGDEAAQLTTRRIVLMGIARARSGELGAMAKEIEPDGFKDVTTSALRLFIRARQGVALTDAEWNEVSEIAQGVGQFDITTRLQFAWAYLKHKGEADNAITQALK